MTTQETRVVSNPTSMHSIVTIVVTANWNYQYHIFGETKGIEVIYKNGKDLHI